jgi:DNA-binding NtrC family response regulator
VNRHFDHSLSHDPPTSTALEARVRSLVPTPLRVLITGETGTGKNHLAYIFREAAQKGCRPFVEVNVANLPDALFEAEFFGCRRGAFTGAGHDREGVLERAQSGILFLNEVGELTEAAQAKLLTVLDGGLYRRLGDPAERRFEARIISATNRDLSGAVAEGSFRSDLYFRLAQVVIEVPPLRMRPRDIAPLIRLFVADCAERLGRPLTVERRALRLLIRHSWPGNVRELRDRIEALAFLASSGGRIPASAVEELARCVPTGSHPTGSAENLRAKIEELERREILKALIRCAGNKTAAARALGLSVPGLRLKMRRLGLPD